MSFIGILNGPHLGRLGLREPEIYGRQTLAHLEDMLEAEGKALGVAIKFEQSNHEGALIDQIEDWTDEGMAALILNAASYTHTSLALADAVRGFGRPTIEVHLTNVHAREAVRHHSYLSPVCLGVIAGLGFQSYVLALRFLATAQK